MKNPVNAQLIKQLAWITLFFIGAGLVMWTVQKKKENKAAALNINIEELPDGNNLITAEDIRENIKKSFVVGIEGMPIGALNVERIEEVLDNDPFIKSAEVYINHRNIMHINLVQRKPALRIIDQNGLNYYLDTEGNKMPLSKHFSAKVLVATGAIPPHVPNYQKRRKHVLKDLFELANLIDADEFLQPMIEQIYRDQNGEYTLIPKVGKQKILLGLYEDIEDKFFRLEKFYQEAIPYAGWRRYKTINLKFRNQVVCKK